MIKSKAILALIIVIALLLIVGFFLSQKEEAPLDSAEKQDQCPEEIITKESAFALLSSGRELSKSEVSQIAMAYGVVDRGECDLPIYVSREQGISIPNPGIGTGFLDNQKQLDYQDDRNYWVISACANNNRIIVDTETGQTSSLHTYVVCGGIE